MSETLQTALYSRLIANLAGTSPVGGQNPPQYNMVLDPVINGSLATGTGSAKANQLYVSQQILAAGANVDLDLSAGLGNDQIGQALAMVNAKVLAIVMQGSLNCNYVASASVHAGGGGTGYVVNDTLTVAGGTGTAAQLTVTSVSSGVITGVSVKTASGFTGGSYTANPSTTANAVTGGTGTSATMDLVMATYTALNAVFTEADFLTIGGDNTANTWISMLPVNTYTLKLYSGNLTMPGFLMVTNGSNAGYAIGSSNKLLKFVNSGSNPVTFNIIIIGATA